MHKIIEEKFTELEKLLQKCDLSDDKVAKILYDKYTSLTWKMKCLAVKKTLLDHNSHKPIDETLYSLETVHLVQEAQFMIECLPYIQNILLTEFTKRTELSWVDVGPGYGGGADLVAKIHKNFTTGIKINVDAIDIYDRLFPYGNLFFPDVNFKKQDLLEIPDGKKWDIVYCSGVIEHTEDPKFFIEQLLRISRKYVFILAPYNEDPIITPVHVSTITHDTFKPFSPESVRVFKGNIWKPLDRDNYKLIFAHLKKQN